MRFLADESCDFAVVRALREAGHDVAAVADLTDRAADEVVIELAVRESRILLTEDKDFGQIVFATGRETTGVILIRFSAKVRTELPSAVIRTVEAQGEQLTGAFVVLQPHRTRVSRLPDR